MTPATTPGVSIQSQVVHGHVGNCALFLPIQLRALNARAFPTASYGQSLPEILLALADWNTWT